MGRQPGSNPGRSGPTVRLLRPGIRGQKNSLLQHPLPPRSWLQQQRVLWLRSRMLNAILAGPCELRNLVTRSLSWAAIQGVRVLIWQGRHYSSGVPHTVPRALAEPLGLGLELGAAQERSHQIHSRVANHTLPCGGPQRQSAAGDAAGRNVMDQPEMICIKRSHHREGNQEMHQILRDGLSMLWGTLMWIHRTSHSQECGVGSFGSPGAPEN